MDPAKEAEGVEQPEQAGGGEHHHGTEEEGQKPYLLLVRRQYFFTSFHGLGTSLRATRLMEQHNPELVFVKSDERKAAVKRHRQNAGRRIRCVPPKMV
jgi:hypothetical protein